MAHCYRRNRRWRKFYRIYLYRTHKSVAKASISVFMLIQQYRSIYRWFTSDQESSGMVMHALRCTRCTGCCFTVGRVEGTWNIWDVKKHGCVWCDFDIFWPAWSIAVYRATRLHVIRLWRNKNARMGRMKLAWDARGVVVAL